MGSSTGKKLPFSNTQRIQPANAESFKETEEKVYEASKNTITNTEDFSGKPIEVSNEEKNTITNETSFITNEQEVFNSEKETITDELSFTTNANPFLQSNDCDLVPTLEAILEQLTLLLA